MNQKLTLFHWHFAWHTFFSTSSLFTLTSIYWCWSELFKGCALFLIQRIINLGVVTDGLLDGKHCKFLTQAKNNELCLLIYVIDFIFSVSSMTFFQVCKCFIWKLLVRGMSDPLHSQPSICFFTDNFQRPHFSSVTHRAPFSCVGFLASLGFM